MTRSIPRVQNDSLHVPTRDGVSSIMLGTAAWDSWVEHARSFRFEAPHAAFTARKEQRPGGWYWYAYRRKLGKLRSAYLGKSGELTQERLSSVAQVLEQAHEGNGSVSTHTIDHHKIAQGDASQIHPVSVDLLPESFIVV